jgi:hypothetical protein
MSTLKINSYLKDERRYKKMKKDMKESISHYVELYSEIQDKTGNDEVTAVILQEIGKDLRTSQISGTNGNGEGPATEKQKDYLKDLGVAFEDSITKKEASEMIDQSKNC